MMRTHFLIITLVSITSNSFANSDWNEKFEEEIVIQEEQYNVTDEGQAQASAQEPYQENQQSILDILFGSAAEAEKEFNSSPIQNEVLSPGEFEVNIPNPEGDFTDIAEIRYIDRTIGKLYKLEIPVSESSEINNIKIHVQSCWNPKEKSIIPESRALINVYEVNENVPNRIFHGWIFAESQNANLIENQNFDITLGNCAWSQNPVQNNSNITND